MISMKRQITSADRCSTSFSCLLFGAGRAVYSEFITVFDSGEVSFPHSLILAPVITDDHQTVTQTHFSVEASCVDIFM